jgi:hypothetical protein
VSRHFTAQHIGPESVNFSIGERSGSVEAEGNTGVITLRWNQFHSVPLDIDATVETKSGTAIRMFFSVTFCYFFSEGVLAASGN